MTQPVGAELGLDGRDLALEDRRRRAGRPWRAALISRSLPSCSGWLSTCVALRVGEPHQRHVGQRERVDDLDLDRRVAPLRVERRAVDEDVEAGDVLLGLCRAAAIRSPAPGSESELPRRRCSGLSTPLASAISAPAGGVAVGAVGDRRQRVAVADAVHAEAGLRARRRVLEARADQQPFRAATELLKTIPGVSSVTARVIVAEIGDDMSRFPTAGNLVSWAGLCPRLDESAGKRRSTGVRHGAPWLKTVLVQAARAAANKRDSYPRAQYMRLKARRGPNKAALAVAASLLTAAYHMLKHGVEYRDLGPNHFDRDKDVQAHRLVRRLKALGLEVTIKPAA